MRSYPILAIILSLFYMILSEQNPTFLVSLNVVNNTSTQRHLITRILITAAIFYLLVYFQIVAYVFQESVW